MLVHVKGLHTSDSTEIQINGPGGIQVLEDLRRLYSDRLIIDEDDEYVEATSAPELRHLFESITPGKKLRVYRSNRGMSLNLLAELSGISKGNLSQMENDARPIGKITAQKLSKVLDCSYKSLL